MKLIKPSFKIIEQQSGLDGLYKQIELAGRTCYKSEDKITPTSAKEFVDRMIKSGHGAMLEHGTVYLKIPIYAATSYRIDEYKNNPYSKTQINMDGESCYYITTNMRVLVEHNWLGDLKYLCEPTEYHEKRICVKFICDRGILAEFTRHRTFSFSAESTRYCNYSKDKFSNELTFIEPCWNWGNITRDGFSVFRTAMNEAEITYLYLIDNGWKPQQARAVLPNALKTELVMTGFISDWRNFFKLRCDSSAHPQARELAIPLKEEFIKRGYVDLG